MSSAHGFFVFKPEYTITAFVCLLICFPSRLCRYGSISREEERFYGQFKDGEAEVSYGKHAEAAPEWLRGPISRASRPN